MGKSKLIFFKHHLQLLLLQAKNAVGKATKQMEKGS